MSGDVLVSDAERDAVATELRTHLAEGRLTTEEFAARVEAAYGARTRAELEGALRQLPGRVAPPPPRPRLAVLAMRQAAASSVAFVVCTLVWLFTGANGDFWPKWVLLAVLIGLVSRLGKIASGDEKARRELERRFGGAAK
jgi:uncharacterized membrane protein YccC